MHLIAPWLSALLPPLEYALVGGLVLFALSWLAPRPLLTIPAGSARARLLTQLGLTGALLVCAVAAGASALITARGFFDETGYAGWWLRPAALGAALAVIAAAALALRRQPLPAPGERAIGPRRPWTAFAPRGPLWLAGGALALVLATTAWQTAVGVSAPAGADRYGNVPAETALPLYQSFNNELGYVAGAGWPNHLATLLIALLAAAALVLTLRADANRPLPARTSAPSTRAERQATARMLTLILLGGAAATLGAVWNHTGFAGQIIVGVFTEATASPTAQPQATIGTGYRDLAGPMQLLGIVLQAAGVALLLRVAADTVRCRFASRRAPAAAPPPAPLPPADRELTK